MSVRTRHRLHTFGAVRVPAGPPTVDEARASLGGRASSIDASTAGAGAIVRIVEGPGQGARGVVVFASEHERDVWIGEGRMRRIAAERCAEIEGPAPAPLEPVAADAARFAALSEGERVRYLDRLGRTHAGTLVEKCRYGALIEADDARVLAVGFRRIAPAP